ncbi:MULTISPECIES: ethanolamine utilization protein EutH [Psychrilyobacter]|uniref:Ethanolamine utilization protein EutH n=1 Tax=Psychrilyobacter piezotolerans TaxID=2293438 RepID=A0ABX9KG08_9FUSO|nr:MULTISPECIES: ethanolamine utilization protein EutH [Psychrilyobacter]MCS5422388.1 ethanolamine utilization protein EutH [Psychrilyobacter sp. S5]NDI78404.1 ethanolamine utilization protein EutH [Psychrilyobacter piezotolerans]RDE61129.1 ethanolamine utilization protein EutH [Psychrilyobacter sp. S5]REI40770.1 ethanolamine utilization protein EutH [Psychrilyobacter piezotolerans]
MGINDIIIYIMVFFMAVGAIDKCMGNRYGYGEKFEEGFMAMGALALAMVGVISLAPVLANVLRPIVSPLYKMLGADPAMFATTLLANDMGGYPLAMQLAETPEAGVFAGLILGAMMGPTIVFTIPVALGIIKVEDREFLAKGVLAGVVTIPLGCLVGGLAGGFNLELILVNLVPIILFAAIIALGLWKIPAKMIKGFTIFGQGVVIVITLALAAIVIETLTGIVVIPGMAPISEGIEIIGAVSITLAGAFPLVHFITKVFNKPLLKFGKLLGMNETSATGMVASLANSIPMFGLMKDMDEKGKVLNVAFAVSAAFVFGDHLGFTAGVDKSMIFPMVIGKLVGGISAMTLASFMYSSSKNKKPVGEEV